MGYNYKDDKNMLKIRSGINSRACFQIFLFVEKYYWNLHNLFPVSYKPKKNMENHPTVDNDPKVDNCLLKIIMYAKSLISYH